MKNPYLFDLAKSKPAVKKPLGTVQGAHQKVFPILKHQKGAMFLVVLKPKGIREPHWHPNAWEFDYCISGTARMAVVAPKNKWTHFEVRAGQIVFVPQGYFHYFENIGDDELRFLVVFNDSTSEAKDDIGLTVSLGDMPAHVLAKTFGVPKSAFKRIPKLHKEVIII